MSEFAAARQLPSLRQELGRRRIQIQPGNLPAAQHIITLTGYHCRIIGAEPHIRAAKTDAVPVAFGLQPGAKHIVRTHSAGKGKHGAFFAQSRANGFHRQGIRNGTLEGGGDIGLIQNFPLLLRIMEQVDNGRFDARKTEIIAFALVKRCMEAECIRVPAFCKLLYLRAAGVRQAERTRCLVKSLTRRIIARSADKFKAIVIDHANNMAGKATMQTNGGSRSG